MTKEKLLKLVESLEDDAQIVVEHSNGIQVSAIESARIDKHGRLVLVESK